MRQAGADSNTLDTLAETRYGKTRGSAKARRHAKRKLRRRLRRILKGRLDRGEHRCWD